MAKQKKSTVRRVKDHDIFMRGIFSYVAFVLKILHYVIPPDLKPFIDFSTLKTLTEYAAHKNIVVFNAPYGWFFLFCHRYLMSK